MNFYELVFITKDGDKTILKNTEDLLTTFQGEVVKKDELGKKEFAYKIGGLSEGHYHIWQVKLNPSTIIELKTKLNHTEDIIRYLLLKQEK